MWCETLKNGKVRYVERYEHPLTGITCKTSVTLQKDTNANRKLAQEALRDKIEARLREITATTKKTDLRLSELVELYRVDQKATVSPSTYNRNYFATESLMSILGADILVERMTAGYVREKFAEEKEKPGTTNERITRLKALLRWGYENDYISDIRWIDKLKKFKDDEKVKKLEEKYLEADELKLLLDNMHVNKWRLLTEFMALSGLRCGEAIALTDVDVDLKGRTISITKTFDPVSHIVTSPKTATSVREVYIQDQLIRVCRDIKLLTKKEQLLYCYRTDLLLSDVNGLHLNYYSYNKYLREVSERLFSKPVTTHYLRHTHVALMAENGVQLDVISRRLGHANSSITKDIYFHVTKKLRQRDNQRIEKIKIL
ncbi:site-specific integrase [Clostridium sp. AF15-17LB]|nr:site-specific integrase [Clostridium sp. AF15-17LB]